MLGMTKTDKPRDEPELCLGARGHLSASAAQAVLADAPDTIADVTFRHFRGEIVPFTSSKVSISDAELIAWVEASTGRDFSHYAHQWSPAEYRERTLQHGRERWPTRHIGGAGITYRSVAEIESEHLADIRVWLRQSSSPAAFIGNGFSSLPQEYAEQRRALPDFLPAAVIDAFDYKAAAQDVNALAEHIAGRGHAIPREVRSWQQNLEGLLCEAAQGGLELFKHRFGDGVLPEQLRHRFGFVFNLLGPPAHTLAEQLQLLRPDGMLLAQFMGGGDVPTLLSGSGFTAVMLGEKSRAFYKISAAGRA